MKALIMGGGMSGLATAINLLDLGIDVELVEADEIFGGRVSSWIDEDGHLVDNALHVFFPYYVNLMNFFEKMGIDKNLLWKRSAFDYMQENGQFASLEFMDSLPAPLHALPAIKILKDFKGTPVWKMIMAGLRVGWATIMYGEEQYEKLDEQTLAQWVTRFAPHDSVLMMEPGINGLTFTPSWMLSAKIMMNWGRKIVTSPDGCKLAFANGGMGEIWVDTCLDYIKSKGGKVELNKPVTSINIENDKVKSVTVGGEERTADIYVSAISPYSLRNVLPAEVFYYDYFKDLWHFQEAPSLSFMVWYDKKLTDEDVTFFSYNCIFNTYADMSNVLPHVYNEGGTVFEMVISPADHVVGLPDEVIADQAIKELKVLFPEARDANVTKWKVVRERQGVYRAFPGMEKHRPYQKSPLEDLYITGDFTKTHVSSGGMEAAIWTANKCTELIAEDKLGKQISLNEEYKPKMGLLPLVKPAIIGAMVVGAAAAAIKALKVLKVYRKGLKA